MILIFMLVWLPKQYLFQVCHWYCKTFDSCVYIAFSEVILIHNSKKIQKNCHVRKLKRFQNKETFVTLHWYFLCHENVGLCTSMPYSRLTPKNVTVWLTKNWFRVFCWFLTGFYTASSFDHPQVIHTYIYLDIQEIL